MRTLQDRKKLENILENTKNFYYSKNWSQLAKQLVQLPPDIRLCGAEINSVEAMIRKKFLGAERDRLILLVSDTDDGNAIGSVLKSYLRIADVPSNSRTVNIGQLQGFRTKCP